MEWGGGRERQRGGRGRGNVRGRQRGGETQGKSDGVTREGAGERERTVTLPLWLGSMRISVRVPVGVQRPAAHLS